ncbi:MAG: hypothetical protein HOJ50_13610, partial [Proteobacteria bacterium]|nr:hypothetical protein [Pseudomonadota bacterium]
REALQVGSGLPGGTYDRVDCQCTLFTGSGVDAAVHVIEHGAHRVENLLEAVEPDNLFEADPFNWHSRYVSS